MKKDLGNIKNLSLKCDTPHPMDFQGLPVSQIMMLVGQNGSGKTLVLETIWALSFIVFIKVQDEPASTQEIFDKTYTKNNFSAKFEIEFESGVVYKVELEDGKVINEEISDISDITAVIPIFMSKNTRLITDHERYQILKASLPEQKLFEMYKLYDMAFFSQFEMIFKRSDEISLKQLQNTAETMEVEVLKNVEALILENEKFYLMKENETIQTNTLSAGEQSLLVMALGNR